MFIYFHTGDAMFAEKEIIQDSKICIKIDFNEPHFDSYGVCMLKPYLTKVKQKQLKSFVSDLR